MLPMGRALDIAAGRGRHSVLLARSGWRLIAVDYSLSALDQLMAIARAQRLPIFPVAADLSDFSLQPECYDVIVNVNFLDRALFPSLKQALKIGGAIVVDTFLIDQAAIGYPKNPEFLLNHNELPELLSGLEMIRHREGLTQDLDGAARWRASAVAFRRH
jgi:tellurite methyltransferase